MVHFVLSNMVISLKTMEINAYILLGFLPPQVPSEKEIKKRYLDLARLHHPDAGGDGEVFKVINNAYHWINDNKNPGPLYFIKNEDRHERPQPKSKPRSYWDNEEQPQAKKDGWQKNRNGNFVMKTKDGFIATVYQKNNQWGWVHRGIFCKIKFKSAIDAMRDFEKHH